MGGRGFRGIVLGLLGVVLLSAACSNAESGLDGTSGPSDASPKGTESPSAAPGVVAAVEAGQRPCAMTEALGSVWVTAYAEGTLVRIDPATNQAVERFDVGGQACGVAFAAGSLWVGLLGPGTLARVDPSSGEVVDEIDLGGDAWDVQAGGRLVWVANRGAGSVWAVDARTGRVVTEVDELSTPAGLA
jgi:streptogramin lyase